MKSFVYGHTYENSNNTNFHQLHLKIYLKCTLKQIFPNFVAVFLELNVAQLL